MLLFYKKLVKNLSNLCLGSAKKSFKSKIEETCGKIVVDLFLGNILGNTK